MGAGVLIEVVCWKWHQDGFRTEFYAKHVNALRAMVACSLQLPHRFNCITDDSAGIDSDIRIIPLWPSPNVRVEAARPNCYRRLKIFSPEMRELIGERILSIDLDTVITGDITPLVDRPEDFVIWGDTHPKTPYNGSMFLLRAGARAKVWREFNPAVSPFQGARLGYVGSDQAWIAFCLGSKEARWTEADGVYSYRNQIRKAGNRLPAGARIVFFHGRVKPWSPELEPLGWIREHYSQHMAHTVDRTPAHA